MPKTDIRNNLKDKLIVVTGATGSLGRELCFAFAKMQARLILACRNQNKASLLQQELIRIGAKEVTILPLDVSSKTSITNFCSLLQENFSHVDIFFHNAGIYHMPTSYSEQMQEIHYATNFWGPIFLSRCLLPYLKNSHIVFMSSISFRFYKLNLNDLQSLKCKGQTKKYGRTKRLLMLAIQHLRQEAKQYNIKISLAHPGITPTEMMTAQKGFSLAFEKIIFPLMKIIFPSPQKAARSGILAANYGTDNGKWAQPRIFNVWGKPVIKKYKTNYSEQEQDFAIQSLFK